MSTGPGVRIDRATPPDDAGLRRVLRETTMPGAVRLSFRREPGFFDSLAVTGTRHDVLVARDGANGEPVGLGIRSTRAAFVNGREVELGYLGGLRILPRHGGVGVLRAGYGALRELHAQGSARFYLSTIVEGNPRVRRLLACGRHGLPRYESLGRYHCCAIDPRQRLRGRRASSRCLRRATDADRGVLAAFLQEEGRKRQFFPVYRTDDLGRCGGLLRGLRPEDIALSFQDDRLVGLAAAWDQTAFRQSWVDGYAPGLALVRPLYNVLARLGGYPALPRAGTCLAARVLALVCVRGDERAILDELMVSLLRDTRGRAEILFAGMHERDPLWPVLRAFRHYPYVSELYGVFWEDGEETWRGLERDRVPYLELGAL